MKLKSMLPYLIVNAIAFYILPVLIIDTGSGMFILLFMFPLICFITSLLYGAKHSFNLIYPLVIGLLFAPTVFIFYNSSAGIYIVIYASVSLTGNFIGIFLNR